MSSKTMTQPQAQTRFRKQATNHPPETTPAEIIQAAQSQPAPMRAALAVSGLTALLAWASFTPLNFSPLIWLSMVPFLLLARIAHPTRWMYFATYLGGLLFWTPTLQWMRLGDATMYTAWAALAVYLAAYFPLALLLTRVAVHRLRVPLFLAFPVVWVGLELARGHLATGFGWYYLGHAQYRWLELIQISDLVGAYGVSFVIAMMSACMALLVPETWLQKLSLLPPVGTLTAGQPSATIRVRGILFCLTIFATVLGYGFVRRSQADFDRHPAPTVAAIQSNVTSEVKHDSRQWKEIHMSLRNLTGAAVRQQPDLIVWPESMFRYPLFEASLEVSNEELEQLIPPRELSILQNLGTRQELKKLSEMAGAALVVGIETLEASRDEVRKYNSAAFVSPEQGYLGRYDKLHRVPFGEYPPLVDTLPWLSHFSPFPPNFGIAEGKETRAFVLNGVRYAPIICFEDTVPHLVRDVVQTHGGQGATGKPVDVLLNLTNDGWFHGSSELDQHLITAAFRCVETRTPMVRSVNTGISAVIDGDGAIRARARDPKTGLSKQVEAVLVAPVPLDERVSPYVAGGDWFAGGCLGSCGLICVAGLFSRWIPKRAGARHNAGK